MDAIMSVRDLSGFTGAGYDKGRGLVWQALWVVTSSAIFYRTWCPQWLRASILRAFGAVVGSNVRIRSHVRVHWPWKLRVGHDTWIGTGAWLLNLEPIDIGSNVCISQGAFLCTGSHDYRSPTFEFDNGPIVIEDGAWVAVRATVLRGVTIGAGAVIGATALVTKSVPAGARVVAARAEALPPHD